MNFVAKKWMQLAAGLLFLPALGFCQDDTTPPVLVSLSYPATVNATNGPQTFTVTVDATDNLSGVSYAYVRFASPSGKQTHYQYLYKSGGTLLAATLTGTITIPQYSEAGAWTLQYLYLYDNAGNIARYTTAALTSGGFPTTLTVTSSPDTTPPTLTGVTISPASLNVSKGPATVTVKLGLTDHLSGVNFACVVECYAAVFLSSPSDIQYQYAYQSQVTQVSGTDLDGVWEAQITIPQYAEAGAWTIYYIYLTDNAGNTEYLYTANLKSSGFTYSFNVTSKPDDVTPPQLTNLSLPAVVDTSTSSQVVQGTLGATDNLSGFSYAEIGFTSPSNGQNQDAYLNSSELTSGTKLNGNYSFTFTMPEYSEEGTWTISYLELFDAAGNDLYLNTSDIINLGLNTEFNVIQGSTTVDGTLSAGTGGTVDDQTFGTRASITVPAGILTQNTNVSIDVLQSSSSPVIPTPQGYSGQGSLFMNLTLTPTPPEPFPAPGISITVPVQQGTAKPGSHMDLYKIDTITGHLVPELSISGDIIPGTVSADGLSATFTGLASLSTVIGLIPNGTPIGDVNKDGVVNCTDVDIVKAAFGTTKTSKNWNPEADVNNDGVVDINDLAIVLHHLPSGLVCK